MNLRKLNNITNEKSEFLETEPNNFLNIYKEFYNAD